MSIIPCLLLYIRLYLFRLQYMLWLSQDLLLEFADYLTVNPWMVSISRIVLLWPSERMNLHGKSDKDWLLPLPTVEGRALFLPCLSMDSCELIIRWLYKQLFVQVRREPMAPKFAKELKQVSMCTRCSLQHAILQCHPGKLSNRLLLLLPRGRYKPLPFCSMT